jgi:hypothetical protein
MNDGTSLITWLLYYCAILLLRCFATWLFHYDAAALLYCFIISISNV